MLPQAQALEADVTVCERTEFADEIRTKHAEIFEVTTSCEDFPVDVESYNDDVNVKSRLHLPESIRFYESIGASKFIIDILKKGHHPKLKGPVPDYELKNNASYFRHQVFAETEIKRLLSLGRIEQISGRPKCVNPLTVVVQRIKSRLILDCSCLNSFVEIPKIKYEGHETAFNYFKKGGYMFQFDLRDGYHHIMIAPEFRTYLGFSIKLNGVKCYFQYIVGCFGLADLPWLFTKIYRPLVWHWRSHSIPCIMFLDDGGFFVQDEESAILHSEHVKKDLIRSGSIYSIKKSNFIPSQKMTWLGYDWDTSTGTFSAASHRVEKIESSCDQLLSMDCCPVRTLSSFVGQIVSLMPVVGNCAKVTTKFSQHSIAAAASWEDSVILSSDIKREINFWKENLRKLNCRYLPEDRPPKVINLIEGDASSSGCGSWLNREKIAARIFSDKERETHSTFRELANVHFSLASFLPHIKNSSVKFLVDNQAAVHIIENGSMKQDMQYFATKIFHFCFQNGIKLKVEWIPRDQNTLADAASREAEVVDIEDWSITSAFFKILDTSYGPFTLDAFANYYNSKVERFYSLYHCPNSSGVDAFSYDWSNENVLLVPPVNAIGRALAHLKLCKGKGVLVAPRWPSAYFWPLIRETYAGFITDLKVCKGKNVLCHGLNTNSLLGAPYFQGDVIAVALDCNL